MPGSAALPGGRQQEHGQDRAHAVLMWVLLLLCGHLGQGTAAAPELKGWPPRAEDTKLFDLRGQSLLQKPQKRNN